MVMGREGGFGEQEMMCETKRAWSTSIITGKLEVKAMH